MDKRIITVDSKSGLKNAIDEEYEIILIGGEYAQQIARELKNNKDWNTISNISMIVGFFLSTPAFIAGIAGKFFTRKLKNYKITDMDEEFITVKRIKK